jgi:hypothetical protein
MSHTPSDAGGAGSVVAEVDELRETTIRQRRERERRVWRIGLLVSLLLHLLLLFVGPPPAIPDSPFAAAGPRADDDRAAEGTMLAVQLSSAPPDAAIPPPVPVPAEVEPPEIEEIEPEATPEVAPDPIEVPLPGTGTTQGADPEPTSGDAGVPTGTGQGDGGTTDEGRFRLVPPTPRGLIIPPTNSRLRGQEIQVWVFVNEAGRVVADSTRLEPPTSDRRFNQQIMTEAAQWVFQPARRDGAAVASWFPYTISMD